MNKQLNEFITSNFKKMGGVIDSVICYPLTPLHSRDRFEYYACFETPELETMSFLRTTTNGMRECGVSDVIRNHNNFGKDALDGFSKLKDTLVSLGWVESYEKER